MKSHLRRALKNAVIAIAVLLGVQAHCNDKSYSSKLLFRSAFATIANDATGKSSLAYGGLNLGYHYYIRNWLSLGFGYQADFDPSLAIVPLSGFYVQNRVYFRGLGTRVSQQASDGNSRSSLTRFAFYEVSEYSRKTYVFPGPGTAISGTAEFISVGVGMDYRVNRNFELNLETNNSIFGFSRDPLNYRLRVYSIIFGASFLI